MCHNLPDSGSLNCLRIFRQKGIPWLSKVSITATPNHEACDSPWANPASIGSEPSHAGAQYYDQPGNLFNLFSQTVFLSILTILTFLVKFLHSVSTRTRALPRTARQKKDKNPSRPSRLRGEKFPSNLSTYAPTHSHFHQIFFQNFPQLLSEHRHLCVNNPIMWRGIEASPDCMASKPRLTPPDPIPRRPVSFDLNNRLPWLVCSALPDSSPRWRRTVGPAKPAEACWMFPMALQALRPTARQRRESGAKGCDHSGTFRPRNRALDYSGSFPATHPRMRFWLSGGSPPKKRFSGRDDKPGQPLVRSVSHRIAMPRPRAPAHRGTDPPGVSQTNFPSPCMEREMPAGQRVRLNACSPPATGGVKGRVCSLGTNSTL